MQYSDLEWLVISDMIEHGYDHTNIEDIKKYWSERLD
jgi:hypothetical protein